MMQVYVVLGGWEYEGCDYDSAAVFADESSAEIYGQALVAEAAEYRYDFYRVVPREVS
jgi:hypothetical protein